MSDSVKVIFDGDLGPLQQKQALAKAELNTFVAESEAEIKGIAGAGDAIGVSAQKGAESFSRYYKPVINDVSRDIRALQGGFERALGAEASKGAVAGLDELGVSLKKLNIQGYEAATSNAVLNKELQSINKQLAVYKFELAEAAQGNIFFAETELEVAAAGKVAQAAHGGLGGGSQPLRGYGGLFRATGLTNAGINETEANAALNIVSKLGISTASLVAVGGVAAIGATAVLISEKMNALEDKRLATQESLNASIYKQGQILKESVSEYEKIKEAMQIQETLQKSIASLIGQNDAAGVTALRNKTDADNTNRAEYIGELRKRELQDEQDLAFEKARKPSSAIGQLLGGSTQADVRQGVNSAESKLERTKKALAEEEKVQAAGVQALQALDKAREDITKNQDKRFSDNFDNRIKAEQQKAKFAEEQATKFAASVKQGEAEVEKLVTGYKEEFDKLYANANKDNPFATQTLQSAKALEVLEQKLKGVGPELRKQAEDLAAAASSQQAYTTQVNASFQTIDLRGQANRFRNPSQRELQDRLNGSISDFRRESNSTNPDVLRGFQEEQQRLNNYSRDQQRQVLDQKLGVVGGARTEAEKAIADKALLSFAGGLNPDDLTRSERSKIADAFERSAVRNETRQEEALKVQRDLLATMQNIDKRGATLTGVNAQGGKSKLDITVKDDTSGGADISQNPRNPTQADTQKQYHFDGFGIIGGSNQ